MTGHRLIIFFAAIAAMGFFVQSGGCKRSASESPRDNVDGTALYDDHDEGDGDGEAEGDHEEGGVLDISAEQLSDIGAEIAVAGPGVLYIDLVLAGEIVMNPDRVAHVVARTSGIAMSILKTVGDSVAVGEALAVLESADLAQAKAEYLSRLQEFALAETDLQRSEEIYANTKRLLVFLKAAPDLNSLSEFSDLDLGENRSALISAYAEMKTARVVHQREKSLYEKGIGSEAEFIEAESDLNITEAAFTSVCDDLSFSNKRTLDLMRRNEKVAGVTLLASERQLHALGLSEEEIVQVINESDEELAKYVITSPIEGSIIERHISPGELLREGTDVFTVANLSTVWVNLIVYPKDIVSLRTGLPVIISMGEHLPDIEGKIVYVSPVVAEETRTATVRVVIDNTEGHWRPGLFVTARVVAEKVEAGVVIPKDAVQRISGVDVVFVRTSEGFEPRKVRLGQVNSTLVEIAEGLYPGENYVAVNAFTFKSELGKSGFEAGHGH